MTDLDRLEDTTPALDRAGFDYLTATPATFDTAAADQPLTMFAAPDPTGTGDLFAALETVADLETAGTVDPAAAAAAVRGLTAAAARPVVDVDLPDLEDDDDDGETDPEDDRTGSVAERFAARDAERWPLERVEHRPDPITGLTAGGWIPRAPHRTGLPCALCPDTAGPLEYATRHQATAYRQPADDAHLRGVGWLEVCSAHAADAVRLMAAALEHAHAPDDQRTRVDLRHPWECPCPDTNGQPITEHHDTDRAAVTRLF